ncbi:MAG: HIT family protein [Chloroflexi bacterium]|uniref:HIT family protein n=1 Tax=Candidatus Chlorohelix allophototropha TaxID=3003348 RepID=A0A8T7M9B9_9CHLR|nr:HIT family protein [Chloroflexota bacterium]WJW68650.1 HIT family protein [Chloroflexota bacterium L227-S17]
MDENCIFCKIVAGKLPSAKAYEDDKVLVFMNLQQKNPGHTLVIPKVHYPNIYEIPDDYVSYVAQVGARVARALKRQFEPLGVNLLQNNEPAAMQSVFHYHVHVIPRYKDDDLLAIWKASASSPDVLNANAEKLKAGL